MKNHLTVIVFLLLSSMLFSQEADTIRNYQIEEVVVSATRMNLTLRSIPQKVEILDEAEIISLPSQNLSDVLKKKTNLDLVQYPGMSTSIGMRGFSPTAHSRSYTLILINGRPSGTTNLSSIGTNNIARIEIVKGPYSVLYGSDAMGGVINIVTKSGQQDLSGDVTVSAGSFGNRNYRANISGPLSEKTAFSVGFSRDEQTRDYKIGNNNLIKPTDREKYIIDESSFGDTMENSRFAINYLNGKLEHNISDNWKIEGEALYTLARNVETPGNYWGTYGHSKKEINRMGLYASLKGKIKNHNISINPYFANENEPNYTNNSDTGFVSFISHIREYGVKIQDNMEFGNFQLLVGADLDLYNYSSERFSEENIATNPYSPDHLNSKYALLSQLVYNNGGLTLNAGGRFNHIRYSIEPNEMLDGTGGSDVFSNFTPSAGLMYQTPFNLKLHGSYGSAFSVPDAFKVAGQYSVSEYFAAWDYWWIQNFAGNPDLKPESSSTIDLGLGYQSANGFIEADITYFNTRHKDKIVSRLVNDTTSYENADRSKMEGIEILLSANAGALFDNRFKLEFYGNFTQMLGKKVEETLSNIQGGDSLVIRDMLYTSSGTGNFGVLFDNYKGFSTRLQARYLGRRLQRDNFSLLRPGITTADYHTGGGWRTEDMILELSRHLIFDFNINYILNDSFIFGVSVSNLFNENYSEIDGYNMPGRLIKGSFGYKF